MLKDVEPLQMRQIARQAGPLRTTGRAPMTQLAESGRTAARGVWPKRENVPVQQQGAFLSFA